MAKGKRVSSGQTLAVYSTKVLPQTRAIMDALAKANGREFGQRQLLEQMIYLYATVNKEASTTAVSLLELLGEDEAAVMLSEIVSQGPGSEEAATATETPEVDEQPQVKTVQTVRYVGNPKVHLYDPERADGYAACGLAGTLDQESITEQDSRVVDCKKCRYCRKQVFEHEQLP